MPDKKKKDIQDLSDIKKTYTANQVDSIIKNSDLTFRDFIEKYNKNTGKTYYIKKVKTGAKLLPNFPSKKGGESSKGKYMLMKKGGITKKETMKKYGHGGKLKTASLLNNVKTSYAMGGVMKMYGKGGTIPNTMKGFSMLPESVQMKMNPEKAKKYGMGGKMEYKYGGMTKSGKGLPTQHD